MKKPIYPRWTPLLFASILFLLIRITNDVPTGDNYLNHSPLFISIEIFGVIIFSYILFFLKRIFVNKVIDGKIPAFCEYMIVLSFPVVVTWLIMWFSHTAENRSLASYEIVAPTILVTLVNLWAYSWLKSAILERHYNEIRIRDERIRNENLSINIKLLQAQYRPHFLFNILNIIYFSINEQDVTARNAVEHLSNLLRRQLYSTEGKVPLSNELSILSSYIELFRLRFGNSVKISTDFEEEVQTVSIYPYLLLPLVENAFKHIGGKKEIHIDLKITSPNSLIFRVTNTFSSIPSNKKPEGGIGLKNLRQQLSLYYGENGYRLETSKNGTKFEATMELFNI